MSRNERRPLGSSETKSTPAYRFWEGRNGGMLDVSEGSLARGRAENEYSEVKGEEQGGTRAGEGAKLLISDARRIKNAKPH